MRPPLIIFLCFLFTKIVAQNNLRLATLNGNLIKVYLDDSLINTNPQADVLATRIKKDTLKVKVEFENQSVETQTFFLLEKGKPVNGTEFIYLVEQKNNTVKFIFTGTQKIMPVPNPLVPAKPVEDTMAKYKNNILGHYCELKDGRPSFYNNRPKEGDCKEPMPDTYLNYMKILMSKADIEDEKFDIAERTTRNNCINVDQLNKILTYITFEIEKLKLIRLAYFHITDPSNKKQLELTFKLESSKRELQEFFKNSNDYKLKGINKCTVAGSESEFDNLYQQLSAGNNDSEKFMTFKKIYSNHCYSIKQVKLILSLLLHDREKLDTAKLLYFYCVDQEDFLSVSDIFSYTSSYSDLKDFVDKQKN